LAKPHKNTALSFWIIIAQGHIFFKKGNTIQEHFYHRIAFSKLNPHQGVVYMNFINTKRTNLRRNFLLCGSLGWCLEVFWTGLHALLKGEATMMGHSSLLMFPIYGCAALIQPLYKKIAAIPTFFRGLLYTGGIFLTEFTTGSILKRFHMCPWDYSGTPWQFKGVIRFDYAPVWFLTGLFFEKILTKSS
jgi:hypothetical protein